MKFENTISRLTAVANPRQIERVVRGSEFGVKMVYDMEEAGELEADFTNIAKGLKLLSLDYLGGHGSRGYGKVAFTDFEIEVKEGECPVDTGIFLNILKAGRNMEYSLYSLTSSTFLHTRR